MLLLDHTTTAEQLALNAASAFTELRADQHELLSRHPNVEIRRTWACHSGIGAGLAAQRVAPWGGAEPDHRTRCLLAIHPDVDADHVALLAGSCGWSGRIAAAMHPQIPDGHPSADLTGIDRKWRGQLWRSLIALRARGMNLHDKPRTVAQIASFANGWEWCRVMPSWFPWSYLALHLTMAAGPESAETIIAAYRNRPGGMQVCHYADERLSEYHDDLARELNPVDALAAFQTQIARDEEFTNRDIHDDHDRAETFAQWRAWCSVRMWPLIGWYGTYPGDVVCSLADTASTLLDAVRGAALVTGDEGLAELAEQVANHPDPDPMYGPFDVWDTMPF